MARNGAWKKWAVGLFVGIVLLWVVTPAERRPGENVYCLFTSIGRTAMVNGRRKLTSVNHCD